MIVIELFGNIRFLEFSGVFVLVKNPHEFKKNSDVFRIVL